MKSCFSVGHLSQRVRPQLWLNSFSKLMYCPFTRSIYCVITKWKKLIFYQNYKSHRSRTDCASRERLLPLWYEPPVSHRDSWTKRSWLGVLGYQHLQNRRSQQNTVLRQGKFRKGVPRMEWLSIPLHALLAWQSHFSCYLIWLSYESFLIPWKPCGQQLSGL